VLLGSGERLPVLVDDSGMPLFDVTVFALTEIRGRNLASNTIGHVLRSIMFFHLFLDFRGVDLDQRMDNGELLSMNELEDLVRQSRRPIEGLASKAAATYPSKHARGPVADQSPTASLEKVRMGIKRSEEDVVSTAVMATRLQYIRSYIQWLVNTRLDRLGIDSQKAVMLRDGVTRVTEAISSRIPRKSGRALGRQRQGLSESDQAELLRVIDPTCPDNPWADEHTRYRNALLIHWLLELGLRLGEALGVRNSDIDTYHREVTIHRRADDPEDPRRDQPQVKTRPRVLPLSEKLLLETQAYIVDHRRQLPAAKKHPFLFVASRTGQPLTLVAAKKIFVELRQRCSRLPKNLSAHVLRHTWNDRFSEEADKKGTDPETEKHIRSYLMGWAPTSSTAATYTRRHVQRKAREVSLALQTKLMNPGNKK